jgi:hypothetical protein
MTRRSTSSRVVLERGRQDPLASELEGARVLAVAADAGYRLVQCETDRGELVWEWRGIETRPRFATRVHALEYIAARLDERAW